MSVGTQLQRAPPSAQHASEVATVGGGCFWCMEAIFTELNGIDKVESGYSGGNRKNPSYEEVCTGRTGHAEVVQLTFDPNILSYAKLLDVFFHVHDPTTLNRQGNDEGPQYRSIVLYHNEQQRATAEETIREVNAAKVWKNPIVTEVVPFREFFKAEDYHQEYFMRNGWAPYCQLVISPEVNKFRQEFRSMLKTGR